MRQHTNTTITCAKNDKIAEHKTKTATLVNSRTYQWSHLL
jgi:hypothetical protein